MGAFILAIGLTIVSTFGFFTNIPSWQYIGTIANFVFPYIYRPQRSWGKVIFSEACVNNSVHGGVCMVARGGHAWLLGGACVVLFGGACMVLFGGVCVVLWGACMVLFGGLCMVLFGGAVCMVLFGGIRGFIQGGAWFYSGGMHGFIQGGGHAWFYSVGGMCGFIQQGGVCGFIQQGGRAWFFQFFGYNEIRSMSGQYASYWNAFLLQFLSLFAPYDIGKCKIRYQWV